MTPVHVNASSSYDVLIGRGLLTRVGEMIRPVLRGSIAMIVTDSNVAPLYESSVRSSLEAVGFTVHTFTFPAGEESKSISTYAGLLDSLAKARLSRKDAIVALGGGVVGDLAGFAAATYLRGIDFVQIPTTLLAAVDSSVGGKTAIDLEAGKNLCGAFHQPKMVICDTDTLTTLSYNDYVNGMAEVIKYGIIRDAELFDILESRADDILSAYLGKDADAMDLMESVIASCVSVKRDIVEADEFEGGIRAILNFGHTAAHAIEKLSGYKVPHGTAVGTGMMIAAVYSCSIGLLPTSDYYRILEILNKYGLPGDTSGAATRCFIDPNDLAPAKMAESALSDKKAEGGSIKLILPTKIGACKIAETPTDELTKFMGGNK